MSEVKTYEQWREEQLRFVRKDLPRTLDAVQALADDVARNGSEVDSTAETLAYAVDGLLIELRERRAADLSAEDYEELEYMRDVIASGRGRVNPGGFHGRAITAAIDKLIARKP